ncbi:glycosyltransferase family 87 protein [Bradyrhizobium sp. OAE829]|uniref:glycosyltransferase family 87 protein n=1 Tax=Bradyrhizobium sp. OAE829 TaxID=2663807 RepID=UPI0033944656
MVAFSSTLAIAPAEIKIPATLKYVCVALYAVNLTLCLTAYLGHAWIYDKNGLGIPTDFISFYAGGRLVLDGLPAQAFDWEILKQIQVAALGRDFAGDFPWHYPPPFFFVASVMALLPFSVAYLGWALASLVPYVAVMRAIVGHDFGIRLALAVPLVFVNAWVGQTGFLTAALIGSTLYLIPIRPVLAGICLGLLTYKPQFGLLFPIALIAAGHWRVFVSASATAVTMVLVSWLAFGTESWLAFFHWLPSSSEAVLTDGRATWWKLQSLYAMVRYFGGTEQLAWVLQFVLTASVAVAVALMWRTRLPYALKAGVLAAGTLLATPYIAIYDMVALAIPVAFLVRIGVRTGFRRYELPALGSAVVLIAAYFTGTPTGLPAMLIVAGRTDPCSFRFVVAA